MHAGICRSCLLIDHDDGLSKLLAPPSLQDKETLAFWLGSPSLVHNSTRAFLDGHRAGARVFKKLSLSEPVTSTDDVGYLLDDFVVDRKRKSKGCNVDGIVRDNGILELEMALRRSKTRRPLDLTETLVAKPMFADRTP